MKKIMFIYNPSSGDGSITNYLDEIIDRFKQRGFYIVPHRTFMKGDLNPAMGELKRDDYHCIIAAGGDGTVSNVVNFMLKYNLDIPLGLFPWGTVNDFAGYLNIPKNVKGCCDIITGGKTRSIDVGRVNDSYFINVVSAGFLTDVAHKTDTTLKHILGKLAYYLKGIEGLPRVRPIKIRIEDGCRVFEEKVYLLLVLNSSSAGGFNKLAPKAGLDDGQLDVLAIKACSIPEFLNLSFKVLKNEHLSDPNVIYFKGEKFTISSDEAVETDVDGELGPLLPLDIKVIPGRVKVFVES